MFKRTAYTPRPRIALKWKLITPTNLGSTDITTTFAGHTLVIKNTGKARGYVALLDGNNCVGVLKSQNGACKRAEAALADLIWCKAHAALQARARGEQQAYHVASYYNAGDFLMDLGDSLCALLTAAKSLDDLMGPTGCSYRPTIRPESPFHVMLADLFDAVCRARGDDRRAWRG